MRFNATLKITTLLILLALLLGCSKKDTTPADEYVKMETSLGTIVIDLYEAETPLHAANFKKLAEEGAYEGIYFHRVIPGFVVQGGDPLTRDNDDRKDDGTGGIGERIPAEIGQPHLRGCLGAARDNNPEKKSNGSQFYFCLSRLAQLDGNYTVFGKVVDGMDVVDSIATLKRDARDNPLESVTILKTSIVSSKDYQK
jgi:cyclophilin family peptidyl-prolyl cis-trans isomerase